MKLFKTKIYLKTVTDSPHFYFLVIEMVHDWSLYYWSPFKSLCITNKEYSRTFHKMSAVEIIDFIEGWHNYDLASLNKAPKGWTVHCEFLFNILLYF